MLPRNTHCNKNSFIMAILHCEDEKKKGIEKNDKERKQK